MPLWISKEYVSAPDDKSSEGLRGTSLSLVILIHSNPPLVFYAPGAEKILGWGRIFFRAFLQLMKIFLPTPLQKGNLPMILKNPGHTLWSYLTFALPTFKTWFVVNGVIGPFYVGTQKNSKDFKRWHISELWTSYGIYFCFYLNYDYSTQIQMARFKNTLLCFVYVMCNILYTRDRGIKMNRTFYMSIHFALIFLPLKFWRGKGIQSLSMIFSIRL